MDKLQFLIFTMILLPNLCNVLLCNYRIYLSSLSMLNIVAVRHIRLSKIRTLTLRQVLRTNMHHRTKFRKDRSNRCGDISIFVILMMAAAAILDFQKFEILTVDPL